MKAEHSRQIPQKLTGNLELSIVLQKCLRNINFLLFFFTSFSYALLHVTRKTFSNVKDSISKEWTPTHCNEFYPCARPNAVSAVL